MIHGAGPYADALRVVYGDEPGYEWCAAQVDYGEAGRVFDWTAGVCETFAPGVPVLVSSQFPVGTCARLEGLFPELRFVVQPENVRAASAVDDLRTQTRLVFGTRHRALKPFLSGLAGRVGAFPMFMGPEDAEMTKHAMNVYLALMVSYGNELGRLCERYGADPVRVVAALRSEPRVSRSAPLLPGDPPSVHLLREVRTMIDLGAGPLVQAVLS